MTVPQATAYTAGSICYFDSAYDSVEERSENYWTFVNGMAKFAENNIFEQYVEVTDDDVRASGGGDTVREIDILDRDDGETTAGTLFGGWDQWIPL